MNLGPTFTDAEVGRRTAPVVRGAKITACWIQHGGEIGWAGPIAEHLRAKGIEIRFVSFLREMEAGYRDLGFPSDFIGEIYFGSKQTVAELAELERRYGPPSLRITAESDVHLKHLFGDDGEAKI